MGHQQRASKARKWTGLRGKALVDFAKLSDVEQRQIVVAGHRLRGKSQNEAEVLANMKMTDREWKSFCKRVRDHRGPER